ncbi:MAG TPA: hypothetical protein VHU17_08385 [Acidimicrobiales bacterium]|nr:hypothetical protein [Acidimicrobiales bacterium]
MNTKLTVKAFESGMYEITAVQGQVVTRHRMAVDSGFLNRIGLADVDESSVVPEVCSVLLQHEALAAVPADSTLAQLVGQYPYLPAELQARLAPGSSPSPPIEAVRVTPVPAEDRPTHT